MTYEPCLHGYVPGSCAECRRTENGEHTEIDATTSITLPPVNVAGVNYTPEMTTFRVTVNNDQMVT